MRCSCCDVILTPQESVRKFRDSDAFTDTCTKCLREIGLPTVEGQFFEEEPDIEEVSQSGGFDNDDIDEI